MKKPHLVYLADDDADYRFLIRQVFKMFLPEHEVRLFSDGLELVEAMDLMVKQHDRQPDVIVLDIDMPRLNGFQTLLKLKQNAALMTLPVMMMTNRDRDDFRQESFRLGASAFLLKPINLPEIKTAMTEICEHEGDYTTLFTR